jgi:hypothetical protein
MDSVAVHALRGESWTEKLRVSPRKSRAAAIRATREYQGE